MVWRDVDFGVDAPGLTADAAWQTMRPLLPRCTSLHYENDRPTGAAGDPAVVDLEGVFEFQGDVSPNGARLLRVDDKGRKQGARQCRSRNRTEILHARRAISCTARRTSRGAASGTKWPAVSTTVAAVGPPSRLSASTRRWVGKNGSWRPATSRTGHRTSARAAAGRGGGARVVRT